MPKQKLTKREVLYKRVQNDMDKLKLHVADLKAYVDAVAKAATAGDEKALAKLLK